MSKSSSTPAAIRLTITPEVARALAKAKRQYPALSDPEILKVGLSKVAVLSDLQQTSDSGKEIMSLASQAVGEDYLNDPAEDIYQLGNGQATNF